MLTEICAEIRNYFLTNREKDIHSGTFTISGGSLDLDYLLEGQYFRIVDTDLNDGVYKYPVTVLKNETFNGLIAPMAIPTAVLEIMDKIEAWESKYANVSSAAMSPFSSESISGVYSYSKSTGANDTSKDKSGTWQGTFGAELAPWRKM